MAKPNYAFEKRQRELAKKKKKEEKRQQKLAANNPAPDAPAASTEQSDPEAVPEVPKPE